MVAEGVWGIDRNRMAEDWRQATEARLSALKKVRALVEEARVHARNVGGLEGVRIDAQLRTTLRELDRQMYVLRASVSY